MDYSLRGLDVGILSLLVLIRHLIFLLGFSSKKNRRCNPNKGLNGEENSGPLLFRELHFRPG